MHQKQYEDTKNTSPNDTAPAIKVANLTKRFGSVTAVDDLSFKIKYGTITGFLGSNGAGKTTTLRMLLGLIQPNSGTALIDDQPYKQLQEPTKHVGAVLEASSIYPGRTARNHLRIRALAAHVAEAYVDEVLAMVELSEAADRRVGTFSLGMRQRLSLATALLGDPRILILDEPANGLDPEGVRWLRTFLKNFARQDRAVLVSSHLLGEVAQTVDEVIILNHGRLVTNAPLKELLAKSHDKNLEDLFFDLINKSSTAEVRL